MLQRQIGMHIIMPKLQGQMMPSDKTWTNKHSNGTIMPHKRQTGDGDIHNNINPKF